MATSPLAALEAKLCLSEAAVWGRVDDVRDTP
jgi:hypothetical protein